MSQLTRVHFEWATLAAYKAMRLYKVTDRQRNFLDCLLLHSWDMQQVTARFRSLGEISRIIEVTVGDLSVVLSELTLAKAVFTDPPWPRPRSDVGKPFSAWYRINIFFNHWRLEPRWPARARESEPLLDLQFPDDLRDAILENFIEQCGVVPLKSVPIVGSSAGLSRGNDERRRAPDGDLAPSAEPGGSPDARGTDHPPRTGAAAGFGPAGVVPAAPEPTLSKTLTVPTARAFPIAALKEAVAKSVSEILTVALEPSVKPGVPTLSETLTVSNPNGADAIGVSTAVPPRTPPVITEEQKTGNYEEQRCTKIVRRTTRARARAAATVSKTLTVSPALSLEEFGRLQRAVLAWVGPEDWKRSHRVWERMILSCPSEVSAALMTGRDLAGRGYFQPDRVRDDGRPAGTHHRICWLMRKTAAALGIKSWAEAPDRLPPRA